MRETPQNEGRSHRAGLNQDKLIVCHSIPGRVRVRVVSIHFADQNVADLAGWLARQPGVRRAEVHAASRCVILLYDFHKIASEELLQLLAGWLECGAGVALAETKRSRESPGTSTRKIKSLFGPLLEVVALTGFIGYLLIRRVVFRAPLPAQRFGLISGVAILSGLPLFYRALRDLRRGRIVGLFPFLALTLGLAVFLGEAMTALEVIWILRFGMLLEDYAAERARRSIEAVLQVAPRHTCLLVDGREMRIPVTDVRRGNTVVLRAGDQVPVDGVLLKGEAMVDEAHIRGRAEPELRRAGDRVFAGTFVRDGWVLVAAEKVGDETYLAHIIQMVECSLANRAPAERKADILAGRLLKLGIIATLGTLVLTQIPMRAFTVMLVMSCPCATVLAASTAISAALANAARRHILIKGGLYLELVGQANCFCFDKTGTITTGALQVAEIFPMAGCNRDEVLALAAASEAHSEHPLARAIVDAANSSGLLFEPCPCCEPVLGRGVRARQGETTILVGNTDFMEEQGISTTAWQDWHGDAVMEGCTIVYVVANGQLQGAIAVSSTLRADMMATLDWLKQDRVDGIYLITGDAKTPARALASALDFDDYLANLLPEDKASFVHKKEANGCRVVMVGDGVNDSLALTTASVGIAMGAGGAEAAIETADIALMDSEPERLVMLRQLSHRTLDIIDQNYYLAVTTNIVGIILGATGIMTPIMGGALHIVHTLGILANSSRLISWQPPGCTLSARSYAGHNPMSEYEPVSRAPQGFH